jgi:hypothetical protein
VAEGEEDLAVGKFIVAVAFVSPIVSTYESKQLRMKFRQQGKKMNRNNAISDSLTYVDVLSV